MSKFVQPNLVQRLKEPTGTVALPVFTFGGGLPYGGLNEMAIELLRPLCDFDYMSSSHFEYGAVPEAFKGMGMLAVHKQMNGREILIDDRRAYILGNARHLDDIEAFVQQDARRAVDLHKESGFARALRNPESKAQGWLELNNPFMYFSNRTMYEGFKNLFESFES